MNTKKSVLYLCDPSKNSKCSKSYCFINNGECHHTSDKHCRMHMDGTCFIKDKSGIIVEHLIKSQEAAN